MRRLAFLSRAAASRSCLLLRFAGNGGVLPRACAITNVAHTGVPPSNTPASSTGQPGRSDIPLFHGKLNNLLKRSSSFEDIEEFLARMRSEGTEPGVQTYNHIIAALARAGSYDACETWLERMRSQGLAPNVVTWTALMQAAARRSRGISGATGAAEVLRRMRQDGVVANAHAFSILADSWGKAGDPGRAESALREALAANVVPSAALFNATIDAYVRAGDAHNAGRLWDEMLTFGIQPDAISFSTLVKVRSAAGDLDGVERTITEMENLQIRPSAITLNVILQAFALKSEIARAEAMWARLIEKGIVPSEQNFNTMILVATRARNLAKAEEWWQKLVQSGLSPTIYSYGNLMDAHAEIGGWERCEELFGQMRAQGITPGTVIWNTLIKARAHAHDPDGADYWFRAMRDDSSVTPDLYTYNTLIYGWLRRTGEAREGAISRAEELLAELKSKLPEVDSERISEVVQKARMDLTEFAQRRERKETELAVVDWLEEISASGLRTFRSTRDSSVVLEELPTSGIVRLRSGDGAYYYWNVATNATSWEPPSP
eukprot:TRINITY_DN23854_c0_g1_i1.p1 TRINITY_DN23854_c0_g1~~TRINITY_DN23854_c0_g1_i1.p1  ORF type:complete len:548 (+),score=96.80 TRINITY_DN23854_c0_g1_i1:97-1740(+)